MFPTLTCICSHLFLSNQHFLWAVNDEVSAGIQRTLVQFCEITIRQSVQQTIRGAKHDGNLANERLLMLCFHRILAFLDHCLRNVHIKWSRISGNRNIFNSLTTLWHVIYLNIPISMFSNRQCVCVSIRDFTVFNNHGRITFYGPRRMLIFLLAGSLNYNRYCVHSTYVRFLRRASFGIIGLGAPSFSQKVGLDK